MMNLRQMEVFRAVMLTGSLRGASELLHVSLPAVSKLLDMSERRAGFGLFDRVKGRLVATPEAQVLYAEVDRLWRLVEHVNEVSHDLARHGGGSLRLVASGALATHIVPRVVTRLLQRFPRLRLRLAFMGAAALRDALADGLWDLGISMLPVEHPSLLALGTYPYGLVCVFPEGHPLASRAGVSVDDLAGERLIGVERDALQGEAGNGPLAEIDFDVLVRSGPVACAFVQAGAGIAVVDAMTMAGESFARIVGRPLVSGPQQQVQLLHPSARPLSLPAKVFCDLFDETWLEVFGVPEPVALSKG